MGDWWKKRGCHVKNLKTIDLEYHRIQVRHITTNHIRYEKETCYSYCSVELNFLTS
jgi:hypothetical protein